MATENTLRERRPAAKADAPLPEQEITPQKSTAPVQQPRLVVRKISPLRKVLGTILGIALIVIGVGGWLHSRGMISFSSTPAATDRIFTVEELAQYSCNVSDKWYLALLGEVFDVTQSPQYYGPGKDYHFFTGRDASRGFITGKFDVDLNDNIEDFKPFEFRGLDNWVKFYHKDYIYKGKVIGSFYDEKGRPKPVLKKVAEGIKKAEEELAEREKQRHAHPDCNMRWSQNAGGEVWCDEGMYPRKYLVSMEDGEPKYRCACFNTTGWSDFRQVYPDCSVMDSRCKTS